MSIVFKPKLTFNFASGKLQPKTKTVSRPTIYWKTTELNNLVELRAIGLSYKDCAKLLGRSQSSCVAAADGNDLHSKIAKKKKQLIDQALNNDFETKTSAGATN
jgi:hypothetical protein